jgi:peroxiredoxin
MACGPSRYAMLIENGKVADISVEPPGAFGVSSSEAALQRLGIWRPMGGKAG